MPICTLAKQLVLKRQILRWQGEDLVLNCESHFQTVGSELQKVAPAKTNRRGFSAILAFQNLLQAMLFSSTRASEQRFLRAPSLP
mmetsp:Transcript_59884/g.141052  ORF Transcript_59884/g.141052 Transcript_59884/m.141052 type:complete len:85 (-) Transcript_59884:237-491(-)